MHYSAPIFIMTRPCENGLGQKWTFIEVSLLFLFKQNKITHRIVPTAQRHFHEIKKHLKSYNIAKNVPENL